MFSLVVIDDSGTRHDIGSVKIGQVDLKPSNRAESGQREPDLPATFDALDADHFSLGQSEDYYASLDRLAPELKRQILEGLRDCAYDLKIFEANLEQDVMGESLLRDVYPKNVRGRLNRLAHGNAELTEFHFSYTMPHVATANPIELEFDVIPESHPPSNVHVIIGRNGVGKTRLMRNLAISLLDRDALDTEHGRIKIIHSRSNDWDFSGIVLVSFSAFDAFDLPQSPQARTTAHQVGLRHHVETKDAEAAGSDTQALSKDFSKSFERCRVGLKEKRWRDAIRTLEVDDLFAEANVTSLLDLHIDGERVSEAERLFERLSSGHAVILLTITRLVELVDEKTLVLLDEPEGHLHPPLLSAFIRCLSDLLIKRNGVAIVATHSPVILQEVPKSAAWKLRRSGGVSIVERPTVETFGENLGLLTREVFGLDVTRSGFHQLLLQAVEKGLSYEDVLVRFNHHLGVEARAIVRALIAEQQGE